MKGIRVVGNIQEAYKHAELKLSLKFNGTHDGAYGPIGCWVVMPDGVEAILCFKRDWLHSFSHLFPVCEGMGWGQTMNYDLLLEAQGRQAKVLIVMASGTIYCECAEDWVKRSEKHKIIRQPKGESEREASIPAKNLKRIYP